VVNSVTQTELSRVYNSRSLLAVKAAPALYDEDIVENILSNFLISRDAATKATGSIAVVISENVTTVIPGGYLWTAGSTKFQTLYPVVARTFGSSVVSGNDRTILPRGDGTFEFTLPVIAVTAGPAGNVRSGIAATPDILPARFLKAQTAQDFTGGKSAESIDTLITRIGNGLASPVAAGGENIKNMLRVNSGFSSAEFSVVGFGNPAQLRDKRSVFPIALGGRVDVYCRTATNTIAVTVRKSCTLIAVDGAKRSLWRVNIGKQDFPGFHRVVSASLTTTADADIFPAINTRKAVDMSNEAYVPDIQNPSEGFLSTYQTAISYFYDVTSPTTTMVVGDTAFYNITLEGQPGIDTLQQIANSAEHRMWHGDLVVKAAVPANVFIDIVVDTDTVELSAADESAVASAAATAASASGFPGKLFISKIVQAASAALPTGAQIRKLAAYAKVLQNDDTETTIVGSDTLTVPDAPALGVTAQTVAFFCHPSNVTVAQN